jgi:ligand-binding sensor domain-containing protein
MEFYFDNKEKLNIIFLKTGWNNTALSLFEDADKNLWVGLDNGVSVLTFSLLLKLCWYYRKLGTVYTSKLYEEACI